jgi:NAD(P) transhydrogenase
VHIGQAVLNLGGGLDYFVENTFNYPTLAEAYKIAALDAFNRMPAIERPAVHDLQEIVERAARQIART